MRRALRSIVPAAAVATLAFAGLTAPAVAAPAPHPVKAGVAAPVAPASARGGAKAPAASAFKALPGYQQVTSKLYTDAAGTQTYGDAVCPRGTTVIGGGAVISSTSLQQNLNASFPVALSTRTWRAYVNNASTEDGTFTVYATCVKRVPGYSYVESDATTVAPGTQSGATATCPAGTVPLGGGGYGNGSSTAIGLNSSYPNATGWHVDVNNGSGVEDPAYAVVICATAPTGYKQVTGRKTLVAPQSQVSADANCPSNLTVLGGGGYLSTARITAALNSTLPNSSSQWRSYANLTSTPRAYLTTYAICGKTTA